MSRLKKPTFTPLILTLDSCCLLRQWCNLQDRTSNSILVFSRTISTFSWTTNLHPDHAQSLLGSTQIKLTTLAISNMATCWNRSSTSCIFTDQRPLPQPHPKPSDLNSNAIMFTTCTQHLHRPREQSHPLLTFSFNLPNELNPKPSALTDSLCPVFTHLRRSPLITNRPINDVVTNGPSFFITWHPRSLRRYSPSPFDKLQPFLIQRVPRKLLHQSRKQNFCLSRFLSPSKQAKSKPT
ncbi:hypothetical protein LXL04_023385 [Taraxacum kok-saghyz]